MSQNSVDLTYMLGAVQTLWKLLVLRHNGITVLFSELMVVYQGKKCICGRDLLPNFCSDSITSSAWLILDVKVWCVNFFCPNYSLTVRTRDSGSVVILSFKKKKKKAGSVFAYADFSILKAEIQHSVWEDLKAHLEWNQYTLVFHCYGHRKIVFQLSDILITSEIVYFVLLFQTNFPSLDELSDLSVQTNEILRFEWRNVFITV